ncbi:MAG: hypothetical protein JXQ73_28050 [Phycisphaerae bacterium]|nr:hypothetical protein [Phycisphaerae bacterium]
MTAPPVARAKHSPSTLERMIRRDMFAVWELSGRCEFTEVPKVLLAKTGAGIVTRYREFLERNSTRPLKDVYREGIEQAIELTNTEYWEPALEVIQTWVLLEGSLVSSACFGCPFAPKAIRARMHSEMKAWWKDIAPRLVWEASLRKFTYPDCTAVPGFPAVVMDTWRNPPSPFGTTRFTSPEKAEADRRQFQEHVERTRRRNDSITKEWK